MRFVTYFVVASIWMVLVGMTVHCVCTMRRGERVRDGEGERRKEEWGEGVERDQKIGGNTNKGN